MTTIGVHQRSELLGFGIYVSGRPKPDLLSLPPNHYLWYTCTVDNGAILP